MYNFTTPNFSLPQWPLTGGFNI